MRLIRTKRRGSTETIESSRIQRGLSDVRICSDVDADERYITLSYCWGPNEVPIKLLESNLNQFSAQLPWADMPSTFRDAVTVVRNLHESLGVRYLWIDALCIIQDLDADKQQELTHMSTIYKYSLCNLAACLGGDSHSGLLQDFNPLRVHECVMETGSSSQMANRVRVENWALYGSSVGGSILKSRAWVLQELTLAPRIVYFTTQQLVWECSEACFYQSSPSKDRSAHTHKFKSHSLNQPLRSDNSKDPGFDHYRLWMKLLRTFTGRSLTYENDKLPAVSAIARQVQTWLGPHDAYVLGL